MRLTPRQSFRGLGLLLAWLAASTSTPAAEPPPDFQRDVRPILSQYCFKCHGPDDGKREAGVRLDLRDAAIQTSESGARVVVPGEPEASELVRRIESTDPDTIMPPPASHLRLTVAQKAILRRWIAAGAEYRQHWAFLAPKRPAWPQVSDADWPRNPIDQFVLARLDAEGLKPSPEASRVTLVRRVWLDLVGVPPTPEEAAEFFADERPDAYERLVERLLASPRYGEPWARKWLDMARYADTNGYEKDRPRSMWPYRDWVIRAINAGLPFDQFTIEQLAGDLLPEATQDQRIATGFHRNTMLNEEGGIDPLEFRFHAMTDRVATTGAVWLGMTVGCAQCHTHKYDPITHREYYGVMAFLDNADEPELEVATPELLARREALEADAAAIQNEWPKRFPPKDSWEWITPRIAQAMSAQGATLEPQEDGTVLVSGANPESDTLTLSLDVPAGEFTALRLTALTDDSLGNKGPGRTPHGNFVVTELDAEHETANGRQRPVAFSHAMADFAQPGFPAEHAIDQKPTTGWAIHGEGNWNVPRTLTVKFTERFRSDDPSKWTIRIEEWHGRQHTLGKFRVELGRQTDTRPLRVRREEHLRERFTHWLNERQAQAVTWVDVRPSSWTTTLPRLELLDDGSLIASGDQSKRDVYELSFGPELNGARAIRLEAMADSQLPKRGPGRVYYEGPLGDFFLSEVQWDADATPRKWAGAEATFANGALNAAAAIDGDPLTGWSINGAQGRSHVAIFRFDAPLPAAAVHTLRLIFERYYAAGLGRFRISYTTDPRGAETPPMSRELADLLAIPEERRTAAVHDELLKQFLAVAPELQAERTALEQRRRQLPEIPTTLVFSERPVDNPRVTHLHRRGEFLQVAEVVTPTTPAFLPALTGAGPVNRLAFARWLMEPGHPLVSRVTANRHWAAFFGRGIVRTTEDFGYQGELPTHPELLDWLAVELVERGWSLKELHRLIVTSATYRQSSRVTPGLLARDPANQLLARGPRVRLEAEVIRDSVLRTAGLLSSKMHGPSVFPPQPTNVTTEGAYGKLSWTVSTGQDRYRRGLYTYAKRTAPYAMSGTFDAPSGEACVPRREISNTPLQALTLLNDVVFLEAAQTLGREFASYNENTPTRISELFQRCLTREPTDAELTEVIGFFVARHAELTKHQQEAEMISGLKDEGSVDAAVWTLTTRALLNLDEFITKE